MNIHNKTLLDKIQLRDILAIVILGMDNIQSKKTTDRPYITQAAPLIPNIGIRGAACVM